jgi:hypothetical protein
MSDKAKIYLGLLIFLGLVLFPVWYRAALGKAGRPPEIVIKTKNVPGKDRCVMPVEFMRTSHMNLLKDWRDTVVRAGDRSFSRPDGRLFQRSLANTCLDCHSNKSTFCDSCHNYMAVSPNCWDYHVAPPEETR